MHRSSLEWFGLATIFHWTIVPPFTLLRFCSALALLLSECIESNRIEAVMFGRTISDYAVTMLMTDRFEHNTFQTYHSRDGFNR